MKKRIAVFCAGDSSEREVSVNSTLNVVKNLDYQKFEPYLVVIEGTNWFVIPCVNLYTVGEFTLQSVLEHKGAGQIDKTDFTYEGQGFAAALIMIHGTPGENGLLQGYLEMMKIPFTTCSSFVSAITFDKHSCKRFLDYAGVKMAADTYIRKDVSYSKREIIRQVGLPMFVKPTIGGSSFGVTKVKNEQELEAALESAFKECDTIIAEAAIKGREMTNGIFKHKGTIYKLPVTEIITKREFFDYEAKYLGESDEICPAEISEELASKIQNLSERIYSFMGCNGVVRMDYIVDENEDVYFLEVNTVPGMTLMSLIPNMLKVQGIAVTDFLTMLIEDAIDGQ